MQAEDNLTKSQRILEPYNEMKLRVADLTCSRYAIHALDWIREGPVFGSADFVPNAGTAERTAGRILDVLREGGVLRILAVGTGRRTTVLMFPELLNVAEGREVF